MKCVGIPAPPVRTRDVGLYLQFVAPLLSHTAANHSLAASFIYLFVVLYYFLLWLLCFARPNFWFLPSLKCPSVLFVHIFITPPPPFAPESNVKPAEEGIADLATTSDPTRPQPGGHQATTEEANGSTSPSDKTPPAQDGPAAPLETVPVDAAPSAQAPLENPASRQDGAHPREPAASSCEAAQRDPGAEGENQPCVATNGVSSDSAESGVLTPSSLTDLDLQEAALDGSSGEPEKIALEDRAASGGSADTEEILLDETDGVTPRGESNLMESESGDKATSRQAETAQKGGKERKLIIVKTLCRDEVVTHRHLDAKGDEGITGWEVPDGLQAEDPSASEGAKPDSKKRHSLLKRNKKKSNQGNALHINKGHLWNASLPASPSAILICFVFIAFYTMSHVGVYL